MIGSHCIRTWSSTQPSVTLSSGEAEFYGLVKASGAGLGHQSRMKDLGLDVPLCVWTDSSAALGIATRSGLGKLRHLETHTLWFQDRVRTGACSVRKVAGEVNPADLFIKHLPSRQKIHQLTALFGCEYREGRSATAPLLRPHGSDRQQDGHLSEIDPLPSFALAEAQIHDINVLPHLHGEDEIDRMFPKIEAAPETGNSRDWIPTEDIPVGGRGPRGVLRTERRNTAEKERERDQDCKPSGKQDFQSLMK